VVGPSRHDRHGTGPIADLSVRILSRRLASAGLLLRVSALDARVLDGLLMSAPPIDPRLRQASPIVVIGMHRSGTRLLVEILDKLGVFMGADRQGDSESVTFMLINEGILHQCGAFWSEPMAAHFMLSAPAAVEHLATSAQEALAAQLENYADSSE